MTTTRTPAALAAEEHLRELLAAGPVEARALTLALRKAHDMGAIGVAHRRLGIEVIQVNNRPHYTPPLPG